MNEFERIDFEAIYLIIKYRLKLLHKSFFKTCRLISQHKLKKPKPDTICIQLLVLP